MNSSDSMNGNEFYNRTPTSQEMHSSSEHTSSTAAEPSSDSGNTGKISTPPSIIQQKKSLPTKTRNNMLTPSKPSTSIKRPREPQEKQGNKPSSKKSKKPAQEDNKGKAAGAPEDEDESDDEEGEGHDQGEQNVNVISHNSESVPIRVTGAGTQRSQVKVGEEEVSSEDNGGEEKDSSEEDGESESECTDDENSALRDSNAASILSRSNIGGSSTPRDSNIVLKESNVRENSTQHVSNGGSKGSRRVGTAGHHDAMENLSRPVQNGTPDGRRRTATTNVPNNEENLAHHVPNGMANGSPCGAMTDQLQMFDQMCKENLRVINSQLRDMLDWFKNEIVNIVNISKKELKSCSNTARVTGFDFSIIKGVSSSRELPSLSKTKAEMLVQKWQTQQFIEMDAASKHLALLQEEYQLRWANFRHQ